MKRWTAILCLTLFSIAVGCGRNSKDVARYNELIDRKRELESDIAKFESILDLGNQDRQLANQAKDALVEYNADDLDAKLKASEVTFFADSNESRAKNLIRESQSELKDIDSELKKLELKLR